MGFGNPAEIFPHIVHRGQMCCAVKGGAAVFHQERVEAQHKAMPESRFATDICQDACNHEALDTSLQQPFLQTSTHKGAVRMFSYYFITFR